ncbi:MAG: hypothetical protein EXS05_23530 [Planctomycetaceae bacterium]|nr:hypothetical protein [Planctomycetaceae bacterium]
MKRVISRLGIRATIFRVFLLGWAVVTICGPTAWAEGPRDPLTTHDPNLYLLADDHWIAKQLGLRRVINRAKPLENPIIWPDDLKTETDCAWGNVIRESDGRFRLWYCTLMMGHNAGGPHEMAKAEVWGKGNDFAFRPRSGADVRPTETMLGKYAESTDGIHWKKPELNLTEFRGYRNNNIILNGDRAARQTDGALTNFDGYTILRDNGEKDPNKRYKMIAHWESVHFWDNHPLSGSLGRSKECIDRHGTARAEYITYSPDGLRWEQPLERLETLPSGGGDRLLVVRDHRHQRWMAYVRAGGWSYPAFSYSNDLVMWSDAEPAKQITPKDVQAPAVECMIPFNYANQDLGFPCGMDKPKGVFSVMLAARHDGGRWTWIENREPLIPYGLPGSYYATGAVPLHNEPFIVGDELLIFFNAFSRNQTEPCPFGTRSIGVAKLRRDGFAGLTAATDAKAGTLTIKPIVVKEDNLLVNVEQRGGKGQVQVALFDEQETEIPGFSFADAIPITQDAVRALATWKNQSDLRALNGQSVRIGLRIQGGAIVYAVANNKDKAVKQSGEIR